MTWATAERGYAKRPGAERQGNGDLVSGCAPENVGVTPRVSWRDARKRSPTPATHAKRRAEMDGSARKSIHPRSSLLKHGRKRRMRLTGKD